MTLAEMHKAQEAAKLRLKAEADAGETADAAEPAREAQDNVNLKHWQGSPDTFDFLVNLEAKVVELDNQAKNLAMLDTDHTFAIRALLIESATLTKVISYARRNPANTKY